MPNPSATDRFSSNKTFRSRRCPCCSATYACTVGSTVLLLLSISLLSPTPSFPMLFLEMSNLSRTASTRATTI
ncbi:hypothetical protein PanWU01x14_152360 [Parasponia andersonii]|uniref:Transmembrane protein n=1 Tax=Parasponia andersonii TaxID=3476 RepID=A0A2P5CHA5_PARAD|nr:hypothetical protein PanWU01x14_152360 [Parasponia andersonii]